MSKYERGYDDRHKSRAHKIAWGGIYSGLTERLYERTDADTQKTLRESSTQDFAVYSYSSLVRAITEAIDMARLQEINHAIRVAESNSCPLVADEMRKRKAAFSQTGASPSSEPDDSHIFTVKVPT